VRTFAFRKLLATVSFVTEHGRRSGRPEAGFLINSSKQAHCLVSIFQFRALATGLAPTGLLILSPRDSLTTRWLIEPSARSFHCTIFSGRPLGIASKLGPTLFKTTRTKQHPRLELSLRTCTMDRFPRFRRSKKEKDSTTAVAPDEKMPSSRTPSPSAQGLPPPPPQQPHKSRSPFRGLHIRSSAKRARESPHDDHRTVTSSPLARQDDATPEAVKHELERPKMPSFLSQTPQRTFPNLTGGAFPGYILTFNTL